MNVDSSQFRGSSRPHLDLAKQEISRFFEKELALLAEERHDRAERLGIGHALLRANTRPS
jgi:hypothetical protein